MSIPSGSPRLTPRQEAYFAVDAYVAARHSGEQPMDDRCGLGQTLFAPPPPASTATLAHYGVGMVELQVLTALAGSRQRLAEVLDWVVKAHRKLEWLQIPNATGDEDPSEFARAHQIAERALSGLLVRMSQLESRGMDTVRTLLKQQLPGISFPVASCWTEFADLLASASALHQVLARSGSFRCRHAYDVANWGSSEVMAG